MRNALNKLNPAYKPPTRKTIADPLITTYDGFANQSWSVYFDSGVYQSILSVTKVPTSTRLASLTYIYTWNTMPSIGFRHSNRRVLILQELFENTCMISQTELPYASTTSPQIPVRPCWIIGVAWKNTLKSNTVFSSAATHMIFSSWLKMSSHFQRLTLSSIKHKALPKPLKSPAFSLLVYENFNKRTMVTTSRSVCP